MIRLILTTLFFLISLPAEAKHETKFRGALSSLLFATENKIAEIEIQLGLKERILEVAEVEFSSQDLDNLWEKLLRFSNGSENLKLSHHLFYQAEELLAGEDLFYAREFFIKSAAILNAYYRNYSDSLGSPALKKLSSSVKKTKESKALSRFRLPQNHPITPILDFIFSQSRAIQDETALANAGFITVSSRHHSYIKVVKHPLMPGYLFKIYLDNELRQRRKLPYWRWYSYRCEGALKLRKIIKKKKLKHFAAPNKWIYFLPKEPSPPALPGYLRKNCILVVEDMNLASKEKNYEAWYTLITPEYLDELYTIISHAGGGNYTVFNIPYTNNGKFAFVDTEYSKSKPDFQSIRPNLSPEMLKYWDKKIKKGG